MQNPKLSQKAMLLPLPTAYVRDASLAAHLAFALCRTGRGNRHQLFQLIRMTYLSYLLWHDGYGNAAYELYCDAEGALEAAAEHAYATDEWSLGDDATRLTQDIVRIYDEQINSVSRRQYLQCTSKLDRLLRIEIPDKIRKSQAHAA
ncbi:hypothetical protein PWP93_21510 [Paraburkholderia sp. A1RI-2L]|uniref:hypothetical protein n=1 Tax=Paraburkholderia sp. A1RI-2L TaxID=3028367 RepID=UPI003B763D30